MSGEVFVQIWEWKLEKFKCSDAENLKLYILILLWLGLNKILLKKSIKIQVYFKVEKLKKFKVVSMKIIITLTSL